MRRTATGVARATPVSATITMPRAIALMRLRLPHTFGLIEIDGSGVEVDGGTLRRGVELQVLRLGVHEHQIGLIVEHRGEYRLHEVRVERGRHDKEIGDTGRDDVRGV